LPRIILIKRVMKIIHFNRESILTDETTKNDPVSAPQRRSQRFCDTMVSTWYPMIVYCFLAICIISINILDYITSTIPFLTTAEVSSGQAPRFQHEESFHFEIYFHEKMYESIRIDSQWFVPLFRKEIEKSAQVDRWVYVLSIH
jgi:hypothetical protein